MLQKSTDRQDIRQFLHLDGLSPRLLYPNANSDRIQLTHLNSVYESAAAL